MLTIKFVSISVDKKWHDSFVGCYWQSNGRNIVIPTFTYQNMTWMTRELCRAYCRMYNTKFAGIQVSRSWIPGNFIPGTLYMY